MDIMRNSQVQSELKIMIDFTIDLYMHTCKDICLACSKERSHRFDYLRYGTNICFGSDFVLIINPSYLKVLNVTEMYLDHVPLETKSQSVQQS